MWWLWLLWPLLLVALCGRKKLTRMKSTSKTVKDKSAKGALTRKSQSQRSSGQDSSKSDPPVKLFDFAEEAKNAESEESKEPKAPVPYRFRRPKIPGDDPKYEHYSPHIPPHYLNFCDLLVDELLGKYSKDPTLTVEEGKDRPPPLIKSTSNFTLADLKECGWTSDSKAPPPQAPAPPVQVVQSAPPMEKLEAAQFGFYSVSQHPNQLRDLGKEPSVTSKRQEQPIVFAKLAEAPEFGMPEPKKHKDGSFTSLSDFPLPVLQKHSGEEIQSPGGPSPSASQSQKTGSHKSSKEGYEKHKSQRKSHKSQSEREEAKTRRKRTKSKDKNKTSSREEEPVKRKKSEKHRAEKRREESEDEKKGGKKTEEEPSGETTEDERGKRKKKEEKGTTEERGTTEEKKTTTDGSDEPEKKMATTQRDKPVEEKSAPPSYFIPFY